jgi:hypothetical protein
VTAAAVRVSAVSPVRRRVAELRFGHPYAVVAVATDPAAARRRPGSALSPWHGVPVFSAWVSEPDDAAADEPPPPVSQL